MGTKQLVMRTKKEDKRNYVLNSLLDKGLYLENKKQLMYYVSMYGRKKKLEAREALEIVAENNEEFLGFITHRAFKFLNTKRFHSYR